MPLGFISEATHKRLFPRGKLTGRAFGLQGSGRMSYPYGAYHFPA